MNAETDRAVLAGLAELDPRTPLSRDRVAAILRATAREDPPRRFALYTITEDAYGCDGEIVGWGMGIDGTLVVHSPSGRFRGYFGSPSSLLRFLRNRGNVDLVWIDDAAQRGSWLPDDAHTALHWVADGQRGALLARCGARCVPESPWYAGDVGRRMCTGCGAD